MYFCEIENFAYGEINERSFSNPHPWPDILLDLIFRDFSLGLIHGAKWLL